MIVAGIYSFNKGREVIEDKYKTELNEVVEVITGVDSNQYKGKISEEKTMEGRLLYSPPSLNKAFKLGFGDLGWRNHKVKCDYPTSYYTPDYRPAASFA